MLEIQAVGLDPMPTESKVVQACWCGPEELMGKRHGFWDLQVKKRRMAWKVAGERGILIVTGKPWMKDIQDYSQMQDG